MDTTEGGHIPPECPVVGDHALILSGEHEVPEVTSATEALAQSMSSGELAYLGSLDLESPPEELLADPVFLGALATVFPFATADCPTIEADTQWDIDVLKFALAFTGLAWAISLLTPAAKATCASIPLSGGISLPECLALVAIVAALVIVVESNGATVDTSVAGCPVQPLDYVELVGELPSGCEQNGWPDCPGCSGTNCAGCTGDPPTCPETPGYGSLDACATGTCSDPSICFGSVGCCPASPPGAPPCAEGFSEGVSGGYVTCFRCACSSAAWGGCFRHSCYAP